jgi:hypothetical protein
MRQINMPVILWGFQGEDAGAALAAAMAGALGGKPEARGTGPLPGGGGLMEEMSALLARRYYCNNTAYLISLSKEKEMHWALTH